MLPNNRLLLPKANKLQTFSPYNLSNRLYESVALSDRATDFFVFSLGGIFLSLSFPVIRDALKRLLEVLISPVTARETGNMKAPALHSRSSLWDREFQALGLRVPRRGTVSSMAWYCDSHGVELPFPCAGPPILLLITGFLTC